MFKNIDLRSSLLVATFVIASGTGISSLSSSAQASNLIDECNASSRTAVVTCCNTYISQHGRPIWMDGHQGSCAATVVCNKKKIGILSDVALVIAKPKCYLVPPIISNGNPPVRILKGNFGPAR